MPKTTKDTEKDELNKKKTTTKKSTTATKKASAATSKSTKKSTKSKTEKQVEEKATNTTKKTAVSKTKSTTAKKESKKKSTTTKKETSKKTSNAKSSAPKKKATTSTAKKKSTTSPKKKTTSSTTKKKSTTKKIEDNIVAEYYDLPYRYNETVVKILYQTPTILFVYWDISDSDKENYIKQYGQNFFNNTKPVLRIYNLTKKYDFEVEINDFANSWYININDANCEYKVELVRKTVKYEENLNKEYIHISSSNNIEFPNNRILLDELPNKINFKNVKTNNITTKDISTMHLVGINKVYKVYDFYKKFYKNEILEEFDRKTIINPSSSSWK